jgi:hypothetical protein
MLAPLGIAMRKLPLFMLCIGVALVFATDAHAKGGSYRHPDPYFTHADKHKTHRNAPVVRYSPEHHHYHLTYHPQ